MESDTVYNEEIIVGTKTTRAEDDIITPVVTTKEIEGNTENVSVTTSIEQNNASVDTSSHAEPGMISTNILTFTEVSNDTKISANVLNLTADSSEGENVVEESNNMRREIQVDMVQREDKGIQVGITTQEDINTQNNQIENITADVEGKLPSSSFENIQVPSEQLDLDPANIPLPDGDDEDLS